MSGIIGKVAVNILTFNRLELLKEVLEAVRKQTRKPDAIIVVNNSSTDGSREWLEKQNDIILVNQENVGSSGGQYTGIKTAYELGYDWIWIMDDDVVPQIDCLSKLCEFPDDKLVRAPIRLRRNGEVGFFEAISYDIVHPLRSFWIEIFNESHLKKEIIYAEGLTFEGPMFHMSLVTKIGLPEKAFFIYGDDTEYFIRAKKNGFKTALIRDAKLNRKLPSETVFDEFNWKYYYIIRNTIAIQVLHGTTSVRLLRPWGFLIRFLGRCKKIQDIKTTFKAFIDGYFYKSINPKYPDQNINTPKESVK